MKVYFPGPMQETFHPRLKLLVKDKVFDLADDEASGYVAAGLLQMAATEKKELTKPGKPAGKGAQHGKRIDRT